MRRVFKSVFVRDLDTFSVNSSGAFSGKRNFQCMEEGGGRGAEHSFHVSDDLYCLRELERAQRFKVVFTRQTNVGQLVLANLNWCG